MPRTNAKQLVGEEIGVFLFVFLSFKLLLNGRRGCPSCGGQEEIIQQVWHSIKVEASNNGYEVKLAYL